MLKPLDDRVVVQLEDPEEVSSGGIILASASQEKQQIAKVIAVGPGREIDGKLVKMQVKVGDRVITGKYSGTEVKYQGEDYIIVRSDDILAVVE